MNEYPAKLNTGYYRVRTDWNDDASQLGAYMAIGRPRTVKLSLNRTKLPLCG